MNNLQYCIKNQSTELVGRGIFIMTGLLIRSGHYWQLPKLFQLESWILVNHPGMPVIPNGNLKMLLKWTGMTINLIRWLPWNSAWQPTLIFSFRNQLRCFRGNPWAWKEENWCCQCYDSNGDGQRWSRKDNREVIDWSQDPGAGKVRSLSPSWSNGWWGQWSWMSWLATALQAVTELWHFAMAQKWTVVGSGSLFAVKIDLVSSI